MEYPWVGEGGGGGHTGAHYACILFKQYARSIFKAMSKCVYFLNSFVVIDNWEKETLFSLY